MVIVSKSSGWSDVSSRCSRFRFWGPILVVIFINDIEDGICGNILRFAHDIKLFYKVSSDDNCAQLMADLRKLYN